MAAPLLSLALGSLPADSLAVSSGTGRPFVLVSGARPTPSRARPSPSNLLKSGRPQPSVSARPSRCPSPSKPSSSPLLQLQAAGHWCFSWRPSGYASLCLWSCSLTAAITSPTATLSPFFKSPSHLLGPPATTVVEHCSTSSMHEQQQPRASSASRHQPARWNAAASST